MSERRSRNPIRNALSLLPKRTVSAADLSPEQIRTGQQPSSAQRPSAQQSSRLQRLFGDSLTNSAPRFLRRGQYSQDTPSQAVQRYQENVSLRSERAERRGSVFFAKRMPGREQMELNELREAFEDKSPDAQALLNSIIKFSAKLPGTRPYWIARRNELEAYVHALGVPAAFLTFSAADNHWRSLHQHMPRFDEWQAADEITRMRISRENLRDNPHIAAWHFHYRRKVFFEEVLNKKFNIIENWHRIEFQGRGSSHDHGLYWFDSAPLLHITQSQRESCIQRRVTC